MVFTYKTYVQLIPKSTLYLIAKEEGGGERWVEELCCSKTSTCQPEEILAVTNRYQHGQAYLTTKGQFDSCE